jgi:hypothetical protein
MCIIILMCSKLRHLLDFKVKFIRPMQSRTEADNFYAC